MESTDDAQRFHDNGRRRRYKNRVEMYREDNNCKAAPLWAYMDALEGEDRLGITESNYGRLIFDYTEKALMYCLELIESVEKGCEFDEELYGAFADALAKARRILTKKAKKVRHRKLPMM